MPVRPVRSAPPRRASSSGSGFRASDAFTESCHGVCGGNPFLLRALVSQVEAEGMEPDDAAAARLTTFGPEQVARSVELQLERLAYGAAGLAHALAVLDRRGPCGTRPSSPGSSSRRPRGSPTHCAGVGGWGRGSRSSPTRS